MLNKNDKSILDNYLRENVDNKLISGCSLAVAVGEDVVYNENYGYCNVEKKYPVTNHTVFRMASNTKVITAVAALICQQNGWLNINDTVDKYIPFLKDLYVKDLEGNILDKTPYKLKIKQLLNHSSGFWCGQMEANGLNSIKIEDRSTLEKFVNNFDKFSLAFSPNDNCLGYSTTAYDIVARIIEIVSGLSYEDFLKKYIFEPLGMKNTTYSFANVKPEDRAISYSSSNGQLVPFDDHDRGYDPFPAGYPGGGAGILSTQEDYLKFAIMLTQGGIYQGTRILQPEMMNVLLDGTSLFNPDDGGQVVFGLSVFIRYGVNGLLPKGLFGWSGAYGTHYFSIPKYNVTVVYLHNSMTIGGSGSPIASAIEEKVIKALHLEE